MRSVYAATRLHQAAFAPAPAFLVREYHGDPGPTTSRQRVQGRPTQSQGTPGAFGRQMPRQTYGAASIDPSSRSAPSRPGSYGGPQSLRPRSPSADRGGPRAAPLRSRPGESANRPSYPQRSSDPNNDRNYRNPHQLAVGATDAFETSSRLKTWMRTKSRPLRSQDLDELMQFVTNKNKEKVNVVVWNQVLGIMGREGKLDRMWRSFNEMKKRAIVPTSRTFTTLLNSFAGLNHSNTTGEFSPFAKPEERTMQRVISIYNQSQAHISECVTELARRKEARREANNMGLSGSGPLEEESRPATKLTGTDQEIKEDISMGPTNAYLKFLARFGLWQQMDKIHMVMDKEGLLAPNAITYSALFSALLYRLAQSTEKRYQGTKTNGALSLAEFGHSASVLWDEAIRQFHPIDTPVFTRNQDPLKSLDEDMAIIAMEAFLRGRPSEQRLALKLIPYIWDQPEFSGSGPVVASTSMTFNKQSRSTNGIPPHMIAIPRLPLTIRAAAAVTSMLTKNGKYQAAGVWANSMYHNESLRPLFDTPFLQSTIHALSTKGDVETIERIIGNYQPTSRDGWPRYVWDNALIATRNKGDFDAAMSFFRRMTFLPIGAEDGLSQSEQRPWSWRSPNGRPEDRLGNRWIQPAPLKADARSMSLLFKSAFISGEPSIVQGNVKKAYNVLIRQSLKSLLTIPRRESRQDDINLIEQDAKDFKGVMSPHLIRAAEWNVSLVKDIESATDILLPSARGEKETEQLKEMRDAMGQIRRTWGPILTGKAGPAPSESVEIPVASTSIPLNLNPEKRRAATRRVETNSFFDI